MALGSFKEYVYPITLLQCGTCSYTSAHRGDIRKHQSRKCGHTGVEKRHVQLSGEGDTDTGFSVSATALSKEVSNEAPTNVEESATTTKPVKTKVLPSGSQAEVEVMMDCYHDNERMALLVVACPPEDGACSIFRNMHGIHGPPRLQNLQLAKRHVIETSETGTVYTPLSKFVSKRLVQNLGHIEYIATYCGPQDNANFQQRAYELLRELKSPRYKTRKGNKISAADIAEMHANNNKEFQSQILDEQRKQHLNWLKVFKNEVLSSTPRATRRGA